MNEKGNGDPSEQELNAMLNVILQNFDKEAKEIEDFLNDAFKDKASEAQRVIEIWIVPGQIAWRMWTSDLQFAEETVTKVQKMILLQMVKLAAVQAAKKILGTVDASGEVGDSDIEIAQGMTDKHGNPIDLKREKN